MSKRYIKPILRPPLVGIASTRNMVDIQISVNNGNEATEGARQAGIRRVIVVDTEGDEMVAVRRKDVDLDSAEGRKMASVRHLSVDFPLLASRW